jgi:hypothetical protein
MVMGSSRGLYPELTYVLDAITATEEKLLMYLRELRAEREALGAIGDQLSDREMPQSHATAQFAAYASPVINANRPAVPPIQPVRPIANQTPHTAVRAMPEAAPRIVETQTDGTHMAPAVDSEINISALPAQPVPPLASQSPHTAVHVTSNFDQPAARYESTPVYAPPELPPAAWPDTSDADYSASPTARRNYNFFADLDARLAALENKDGSEQTE